MCTIRDGHVCESRLIQRVWTANPLGGYRSPQLANGSDASINNLHKFLEVFGSIFTNVRCPLNFPAHFDCFKC
jgi:hypothetical protein